MKPLNHSTTQPLNHSTTKSQSKFKKNVFRILKVSGVFLLLFCNVYFVSAQGLSFSTVSAFTSLNTDQNKVVSYVSSLPRVGSMLYLTWDNSAIQGTSDSIRFLLPGVNSGNPVSYKVADAFFVSTTDYIISGASAAGDFSLYKTSLGTGGSITYQSHTFSIYPLESNRAVLIENNRQIPGITNCFIPSGGESVSYCSTDCGPAIVDVLLLITPEAKTWMQTTYGYFSNWILFVESHNINIAFVKSGISNKSVRVHMMDYTPDFPLTVYIGDDLDSLQNNASAKAAREQKSCDIAVLLTKRNYGPIFGASNSDNPTFTNKFCIVRADYIDPSRYTLAHELGHQLGCQHSSLSNPGCQHGKNMLNGSNTIMADNAMDYTRIQHFSNPSISYAGESTGETDFRDNAAQIRGSFCDVSNVNKVPTYSAIAYFTSEACPGLPLTATALVAEGKQRDAYGFLFPYGVGPYTYEWTWSNTADFAISYNIGNSVNLSLPSPPACPSFYLRLKVVSSDGYQIIYTDRIFCQPASNCGDRALISSFDGTSDRVFQLYPNPADQRVVIKSNSPELIKSIQIVSSTGNLVFTNRGNEINQYEYIQDVSFLPNGVYWVIVHGENSNQTIRFAIVK